MKKKALPKGSIKKLDPSRATIYVASLALIGTVTAAAIAKAEVFIKPPAQTSQADQVVAVQDFKFKTINQSLDEQITALTNEQSHLDEQKLTPAEQTEKKELLSAAITKSLEAKSKLSQGHPQYKEAVKGGNLVAAQNIQTDINDVLINQWIAMRAVSTTPNSEEKKVTHAGRSLAGTGRPPVYLLQPLYEYKRMPANSWDTNGSRPFRLPYVLQLEQVLPVKKIPAGKS